MELFSDRIFQIDTENAFKLGPVINQVECEGNKVIKLNLGEPDFNVPEFIKTEIKRQIDLNNTHYCDPKGLLSLREAISKEIFRTRNLNVSPEQVVIFPGAKPGIGFTQEIYCNPNDEVIYPSPGFPIYESFIKYLGAIPKPIHLKESMGFNFSAEELESLITPKTKLIFLNFPSNPTGGVASLSQLQKIREVILAKGSPNLRIFSDEIYEHIIYDGHSHHSIASLPDMAERTIISSGFSKTYAWTGGRIGYAVLPSIKEADVFKNLNINYFSCVPPYNQEAARIALEHPLAQSAISKMVKIFEERRNAILEELNTIQGLKCQNPKGAFYVFPNIEQACHKLGVMEAYQQLEPDLQIKTTPSTLFQMFALLKHHVAVLDRRSFGQIGSAHEHYIRLSFAADISVIKEGIKRLKHAFEDRENFLKFVKSSQDIY